MSKYFTIKTIEFFVQIGLNNHKSWYLEHKNDYEEHILEPFKNLVLELSDTMLKIDPLFIVEPKVDKTISRIYKDIRFSKDKLPYRNNAWITFKIKSDEWKSKPCFYFEITHDSYRYGMGFYNADTKTISNFRNSIETDKNEFETIIKILNKKGIYKLEGDNFKRLINPGLAEDLWEYYRKKSFYLASNHEIDDFLFSEKLSDRIKNNFLTLKPLYDYLNQLISK